MGLWRWLDDRLGLRDLGEWFRREMERPVPDHVNWSFTLGLVAFALFMLQAAGGLLLALNYTPSMKDAYDSAARITNEIEFGWLIRSLHAWGADLMVIVLILHALRVFLYSGYKRPRELTWIIGAGLLLTVLAMGFTGCLLPMEQRSYWATVVATNALDDLPLLGDTLVRMVRGGDAIGDPTLGRFYVMHILVLPGLLLALVGLHLRLVRRLGISLKLDLDQEERSGPPPGSIPYGRHFAREIVAIMLVLGLVVTLAVLLPREVGDRATPQETPRGIKPEWYFLPMYQTLKYFPKLPGLLIISAAVLLFIALPFLDRSPARLWTRRRAVVTAGLCAFAVVFLLGLLGYLSEGSWEIFGRIVEFDTYGRPILK